MKRSNQRASCLLPPRKTALSCEFWDDPIAGKLSELMRAWSESLLSYRAILELIQVLQFTLEES
jgi:hypothetical protein